MAYSRSMYIGRVGAMIEPGDDCEKGDNKEDFRQSVLRCVQTSSYLSHLIYPASPPPAHRILS